MSDFLTSHGAGIGAILGSLASLLGVLLAAPEVRKFLRFVRSKQDLNSAYYHVLEQLNTEKVIWRETLVSWKETATALRTEMVVLKGRVTRVENELAIIIPKYKVAISHIKELRVFHRGNESELPPIPAVIEKDYKNEDHPNVA